MKPTTANKLSFFRSSVPLVISVVVHLVVGLLLIVAGVLQKIFHSIAVKSKENPRRLQFVKLIATRTSEKKERK